MGVQEQMQSGDWILDGNGNFVVQHGSVDLNVPFPDYYGQFERGEISRDGFRRSILLLARTYEAYVRNADELPEGAVIVPALETPDLETEV